VHVAPAASKAGRLPLDSLLLALSASGHSMTDHQLTLGFCFSVYLARSKCQIHQ
jgi:hypothetical protein